MNELKHALDQAIPHFHGSADLSDDALAALTRDGKRALRQRRARIGGAITTGGVGVAGLALGAVMIFGQGDQPASNQAGPDPSTSGPSTSGPSTSGAPLKVKVNLASLQEQYGKQCNYSSKEGIAEHATDTAQGDGWVSAQFDCGPDGIVRTLEWTDPGAVPAGFAGIYRKDLVAQGLQEWSQVVADGGIPEISGPSK